MMPAHGRYFQAACTTRLPGYRANAVQPLLVNCPVIAGDVKAYIQAAPTGQGITSRSVWAALTG